MNKKKSQHFYISLVHKAFDLVLYLAFLTLVTRLIIWTIK